jgi:hypothetical protein
MASPKKSLWSKIGRIITGLIVVLFFLPFFAVSCQGDKGESIDVVTISGFDMVGGCKPGGLLADAADSGDVKGGEVKIENVAREPLAILALAFCLTAFALAWVRKRTALLATFVIALAGLGALGGLYVKVKGRELGVAEGQGRSDERVAVRVVGGGGRAPRGRRHDRARAVREGPSPVGRAARERLTHAGLLF